jgi:hypothetical protein
MKSESIKDLAAALSKAQGAFDHAKKDVKNEFFKSKYADLASCIDAAKKPLSENGLSVVQTIDFEESGMFLVTTLMHCSGEWIEGRYPIRPLKTDPQSVGSATSYARRYCFCAITGIAADDDDGNSASGNSTIQNKQQDPVNYAELLKSAKDKEQLGKVWASIPKPLQAQFLATKDAMKATFEPQQEVA